MRAYYYLLALDYFGNVPIVKDFNTNPNTVKIIPAQRFLALLKLN